MWNERFSAPHYIYGTEPNGFLAAHYREIPMGRVLCLGEGEGRNAVFLARQGYSVTAVDLSEVGLEKAARLAAAHSVQLECIHADLATFPLGSQVWEGIVSIFCHLPPAVRRNVMQQVPGALREGGIFLLEAYTPAQLAHSTGGPRDESLLLTAALLQQELPELIYTHLQELERDVTEGTHHTGVGAVLQAIARRPDRTPRAA